MSHKWAGPFLQPVDPIALDLPDYFDIVKNPMDFGTLQRRIETQMVTSKEEFAALARQIFANALLYNKPDSDVCVSLRTVSCSGVMARVLSEEFEKEFLQITGRIFAAGPEPSRAIPAVSRRSQTFEEPAAKEPPGGETRGESACEAFGGDGGDGGADPEFAGKNHADGAGDPGEEKGGKNGGGHATDDGGGEEGAVGADWPAERGGGGGVVGDREGEHSGGAEPPGGD